MDMAWHAPPFLALDWNGTVVPIFGCPAYPQAMEILKQLRSGGLPLFVVSHATQAQIEADVQRTGLEVDGIFGCGDKAPIFSDLHLQHGRGLVLGDHPADGRAAQEAGLPFLQACLEGQMAFPGQTEVFRHWSEVPDLLLAGQSAER
ncbi:MAG: HAD family hydrolase [Planctomycetota bacterium]